MYYIYIYIYIYIAYIYLRSQLMESSLRTIFSGQLHVYEPSVLLQILWQGLLTSHSLISISINMTWLLNLVAYTVAKMK